MEIDVKASEDQSQVIVKVDGATTAYKPADAVQIGNLMASCGSALLARGSNIPQSRSLDELAREAGKT